MNTLPRGSASDPELSPLITVPRTLRQKLRYWLRSRSGRIVVPCLAVLLGLLLGIASTLGYLSSLRDQDRLFTPGSRPGQNRAIVIELSRDFLTNIVRHNLLAFGLPGTVKNVQLTFTSGDQMTITADDEVTLLGLPVSRQFTIVTQATVVACQPHIHILRADLGRIPITGSVSMFEGQINQAIMVSPTSLPEGFNYCTVNVRTAPEGLFATFSAVPKS